MGTPGIELDSKLVLAMDVFDTDFALDLAKKVGSELFAIKINWPITMVKGASIIKELSEFSRVICDYKIADIPNTNTLIATRAVEMGAWGIISHSITGRDSLEAVAGVSQDLKVFSVVAMSHPGASEFIYPNTDRLVQMSREAGVYGLIAPGNDYGMLSHIKEKAGPLKIMTPGVGAQGGSASEAVRHGSDLVIVGRAIYNSDDPVSAVRKFNQEISKA